jgi:hypothetical protein
VHVAAPPVFFRNARFMPCDVSVAVQRGVSLLFHYIILTVRLSAVKFEWKDNGYEAAGGYNSKNAFMSGLRAEKPLQYRNLAIDRYGLFYLIRYGVFELLMFYKGGVRKQTDSPSITGKDFFISQTCHLRLLIAVFWVN